MDADPQLPAFIQALAYLTGIAGALWGLWCTIVAFIGGTLPIPGLDIEMEGGIGTGLLFLFIGEPLIVSIAGPVVAVLLTLVSAPFVRGKSAD